ncbi:hypothetical protein B7494_g5998 [Chlorociboria aeruginascens]|nr:hypothetical protein B7494_g5998 [Chlorociboria aeruginascens]
MYPATQPRITLLFTLLTLITHISALVVRNPLPTQEAAICETLGFETRRLCSVMLNARSEPVGVKLEKSYTLSIALPDCFIPSILCPVFGISERDDFSPEGFGIPSHAPSIVIVVVSLISGSAIGEMPSQTVGYGQPFFQQPTPAPSRDLVKARFARRDLTNTCTEWTIPGGFGQPQCSNSETCLFATGTDGYYYEGCGQTSISYDWVTQCWNYGVKTGVPPVSEIYCPAAEPSCGYLAFIGDASRTFYNFGCSAVSYGFIVDLLATTPLSVSRSGADSASASFTSDIQANPISSASISQFTSSGTDSILGNVTPTTTMSAGKTATVSPTSQKSGAAAPVIGTTKRSKKKPIGAIVGGVIGGVVALVIIALCAWLFRKNKRDKDRKATEAAIQQEQADSANTQASHSHQISEMGGKQVIGAGMTGGYRQPQPTYGGNPNEKPIAIQQPPPQQEIYRPPPSVTGMNNGSQSPPPLYSQPQSIVYNTYNPSTVEPTSPGGNLSELGQSEAAVRPVSPMINQANELGTDNRSSYQPPPDVQEMGSSVNFARPGPENIGGRGLGTSGMSLDMSGNPMSEDYRQHELP